MENLKKLVSGDEGLLASFLGNYPETSMFLRSNLNNSGVKYQNDAPFYGEYFACFDSTGEISGVLAHYWNGNVMMQCPDPIVLETLVAWFLSQRTRPICGILGDERQAKTVITLLGITESLFALNSVENLFQLLLSDLVMPDNMFPDYQLLKVKNCDSNILREWLTAYHAEALGADLTNPVTVESVASSVNASLRNEDLWVLAFKNRLVSLCGFNARVFDIVQIGPVWTPVEFRNQGYARRAVAMALYEARKNNMKRSILFTNSVAAERAYCSIGFKNIGEYRLALLKD